MDLGKEGILTSEGRRVFSWGDATSSILSFCQIYLYIYWSTSAFCRTLYLVEHSFFCPCSLWTCQLLEETVIFFFFRKRLMCRGHILEIRSSRGRPLKWWMFSCFAAGFFHLTKGAGMHQAMPTLVNSKGCSERIPWANGCWRKESVMWACDVAGERILSWFTLFFIALVRFDQTM